MEHQSLRGKRSFRTDCNWQLLILAESNMTISSRTPEGDPNACLICGNQFRLEKSIVGNDAPCPHCGCLLFFDSSDDGDGDSDLTREFLRTLQPPSQATINRLDSDFLEQRHAIVLGMHGTRNVVGLTDLDLITIDEIKEHVSPSILVIQITHDFYSANVFRQRQRLRKQKTPKSH